MDKLSTIDIRHKVGICVSIYKLDIPFRRINTTKNCFPGLAKRQFKHLPAEIRTLKKIKNFKAVTRELLTKFFIWSVNSAYTALRLSISCDPQRNSTYFTWTFYFVFLKNCAVRPTMVGEKRKER